MADSKSRSGSKAKKSEVSAKLDKSTEKPAKKPAKAPRVPIQPTEAKAQEPIIKKVAGAAAKIAKAALSPKTPEKIQESAQDAAKSAKAAVGVGKKAVKAVASAAASAVSKVAKAVSTPKAPKVESIPPGKRNRVKITSTEPAEDISPSTAKVREMLGFDSGPVNQNLVAHKFEASRGDADEMRSRAGEMAVAEENLGELPESYGSRKLFLTARDPQWLFAYWDLTWDQFHELHRSAYDGKVFLKILENNGNLIQQLQIGPEARNWYIHVERPNTTFFAQLGYYDHAGHFVSICESGRATTPRDSMSNNTNARFVTIPINFTFRELLEMIKAQIRGNEELAEALARLQEEGYPFPFKTQMMAGDWTRRQEQALMDFLGGDIIRRIQMDSMEITEILRQRLLKDMSSAGVSSFSSPMGASRGRGFWMNVNAEVIIYGATDPNARVVLAGKEIKLRPDGTFSYHWSFPEGKFEVPIEATSPDAVEKRGVRLTFNRRTSREGEVTDHPQDEKLQRPVAV